MQLNLQEPPKVRKDGTFDITDVIIYANAVGTEKAAKDLKVPLHRIIFFQSKKEGK